MAGLAWRTVKDMDRSHLEATLPALHPSDLTGLRSTGGVDEVARAKGHDYVTVVYDLDTGALLWVGDGKSADSLAVFLAELSQETADGIQAVAMDMGPAYQAAVRRQLPNAVIVFDRFHVMKLYSDVTRKVRKAEFRKADADGKHVIKGSLYLLMSNKQRLDESGIQRLGTLMQVNQTLSTVYTLKEQLQALWSAPDETAMRKAETMVQAGASHLHHAVASLRGHAGEARRGHLRLRAIQDHHRSHRGRQCRHRHDPQTRPRAARSELLQTKNQTDRNPRTTTRPVSGAVLQCRIMTSINCTRVKIPLSFHATKSEPDTFKSSQRVTTATMRVIIVGDIMSLADTTTYALASIWLPMRVQTMHWKPWASRFRARFAC